MGRLTDLQLKSLKNKVSEPIGSRGDGALMFWRRPSGVIEAYYRYRTKGKESLVKIGPYKATRSGHGYTLAECRDKAQELATIRRECVGDLKEHIQAEEQQHQEQQKALQNKLEREALQGTLQELCGNYIASLERQNKKSVRTVENCLQCYVLKPFPKLAATKARDITVDDIVSILRRMIENGITTTSNRVRSYLHAAYVYGIKADSDPREQVEHGKRFLIEHNPVAAVPRQADYERVKERYLNHEEIRKLWYEFIPSLPNRNPMFGLLLRFMIATGGNRPEQLRLCRWSDFDMKKRTFTFIERKGKSGAEKKRVMPLTSRAIGILEEIEKISGGFEWPFCITGKSPLKTSSLSNRVKEYVKTLETEARENDEQAPEPFTPRDIRTTATNLLIECRIPKEQRYLIQSREDGSIESKRYDHSDRLPEKRDAMKQYDAFLDRILKGKTSKLVDFEEYKQSTSQQNNF